jgi:hypothetical protein
MRDPAGLLPAVRFEELYRSTYSRVMAYALSVATAQHAKEAYKEIVTAAPSPGRLRGGSGHHYSGNRRPRRFRRGPSLYGRPPGSHVPRVTRANLTTDGPSYRSDPSYSVDALV